MFDWVTLTLKVNYYNEGSRRINKISIEHLFAIMAGCDCACLQKKYLARRHHTCKYDMLLLSSQLVKVSFSRQL